MKKNVIFFLFLVSLSLTIKLKRKVPRVRVPKSTIFITADNELIKLFINGNEVDMPSSQSDNHDWTITKKWEMYLFAEDNISIQAKNRGYISGMIATIHFFDKFGKEHTYSTGKEWVCGDKPAKMVGKNDGKNLSFAKIWSQIPEIDITARWIGDIKSSVHGYTFECNFDIPSCPGEEME